ncbi:hypothetical protein Q7P35_009213 [Cladosporium inversicolor]
MSRGGRGGRGGGRGGLSSAARLNSGAVPFDIDEELEREFAKQKEDSDNFFPSICAPSGVARSAMASQFDVDDEQELNLFQEHFPHLAAPPTEEELEEVHQYLDICARMKKGWLSEAIRKLDAKKMDLAKQAEHYNPFDDVPQYGKKNTVEKTPRFSDFPFKKEHFPKELWDVIDPKGESDNPAARKKTLKINTKSARDKLADFDDDEVENEADNEATEKKNPEDDEVEELEDDEFDEDENDDMADDYNAERYFEDGEEDYEDGGGGGDDDDGSRLTRPVAGLSLSRRAARSSSPSIGDQGHGAGVDDAEFEHEFDSADMALDRRERLDDDRRVRMHGVVGRRRNAKLPQSRGPQPFAAGNLPHYKSHAW